MFDESLLESSPSRAPVLKGKHWLISLALGVVVFLTIFFGLPMVSFGAETKVVTAQAIILGVLTAGYALMLCYVWADARHLKLSAPVWFAITFLFNVVGFIVYLIYSAIKTDNWKRATLPIAYICEGILVGLFVLVPLIYTEALPSAQLMTFLAAPPPPPPPPPPPAAAPAPRIVHKVTMEDIMKAPTVIPKTIARPEAAPAPASRRWSGRGHTGRCVRRSVRRCARRSSRRRDVLCFCSSPPTPTEGSHPETHPRGWSGGKCETHLSTQT